MLIDDLNNFFSIISEFRNSVTNSGMNVCSFNLMIAKLEGMTNPSWQAVPNPTPINPKRSKYPQKNDFIFQFEFKKPIPPPFPLKNDILSAQFITLSPIFSISHPEMKIPT
ncbi:MAG: hypothetical protein SCH70_14320 [Candidatus Methanoperedens sp.]|nr:hypothetical protein [Candidatus Methanoperedens sp.]